MVVRSWWCPRVLGWAKGVASICYVTDALCSLGNDLKFTLQLEPLEVSALSMRAYLCLERANCSCLLCAFVLMRPFKIPHTFLGLMNLQMIFRT
jgi:hypothetical protein